MFKKYWLELSTILALAILTLVSIYTPIRYLNGSAFVRTHTTGGWY